MSDSAIVVLVAIVAIAGIATALIAALLRAPVTGETHEHDRPAVRFVKRPYDWRRERGGVE